jgi:hypothetical protein
VDNERNLKDVLAPPTLILPVVLLAFVTLCVFAYAVRERSAAIQSVADAARLTAENKRLTLSLGQTQSEIDALEAKLNATRIAVSQLTPPSPQPLPVEPNRAVVPGAARRLTGQSRQWMKVENQLAAQQRAIASTQRNLEKARMDLEEKLSSARDELNGSIARTHDELVALEKKGERNYYEFDLVKSKQFQRVGPLSLSLRKANAKHEYFDMAMVVDDRELNKNHVNLYEPLLIYPADSHQPLEIVVNKVSKDKVDGYVSAPKYMGSRDAASGVSAGTASTAAPSGNAVGSTSGEGPSPTQATLSQKPSPQP